MGKQLRISLPVGYEARYRFPPRPDLRVKSANSPFVGTADIRAFSARAVPDKMCRRFGLSPTRCQRKDPRTESRALARRASPDRPAAPKVRHLSRQASGLTGWRFGCHLRILLLEPQLGNHKLPRTHVGSPPRGLAMHGFRFGRHGMAANPAMQTSTQTTPPCDTKPPTVYPDKLCQPPPIFLCTTNAYRRNPHGIAQHRRPHRS